MIDFDEVMAATDEIKTLEREGIDRSSPRGQQLVTSEEQIYCPNMKNQSAAQSGVRKAYNRLCTSYPIENVTVHHAVMDLATAGWTSQYFHINLQMIRERGFEREPGAIGITSKLTQSLLDGLERDRPWPERILVGSELDRIGDAKLAAEFLNRFPRLVRI